jgi:dATP pyrophosphohydrolase
MSRPESTQPVPVSTGYVCAYIVRKDIDGYKFLLLRRQSRYMRGLWGQVAGKVEDGETAARAALRETIEETGQRPMALYSADVIESFYDIEYNRIQLIPVFVAFMESDNVTLSFEHSEYCWATPEEARALFPFPLQRASVDLIVRDFLENEPPEQLRINLP